MTAGAMTPDEMAALQARAYTHMPPWSALALTEMMSSPLALLVTAPNGFALARVVADEAELLALAVDPDHLRRLTGLYYEFQETGIAEKLGYTNPADLAEDYPDFFWNVAQPYLKDALRYLQLTQEGKQWIANLHSHVFAMEHGQIHLGPFSGKN